MNPPYDKGLHLKFLEKVINISDNVVSVQPISAFQKSIAYKTKLKEDIKVSDIESIPVKEACIYFPNTGIREDLGIILVDDAASSDFSNLVLYEDSLIINKCINFVKTHDNLKNHLSLKKDKGLLIKMGYGSSFYHGNGKIMPSTFRLSAINYELATSREDVGHVIYLNNIPNDKIRRNIWEFYNSIYMRYWNYRCLFSMQEHSLIPFLGFNRYKKSWTVDDYKNFFVNEIGLTEEEWNTYKTEAEKLPV